MSREIKFRAWDGKSMHNWDSVNHSAVNRIDGTPYPKLFYLPMSWLVGDSNDWVWMQYTGLKDKNGKEIWERDAVRWQFKEERIEYEVIFRDGSFGCVVENQFVPLSEYTHQLLEVIGNIYENPKLLEDYKLNVE